MDNNKLHDLLYRIVGRTLDENDQLIDTINELKSRYIQAERMREEAEKRQRGAENDRDVLFQRYNDLKIRLAQFENDNG